MNVQDLELALRTMADEVRPDEVDAFRNRLAVQASPRRRPTRRRIAVLGGLSALLLGGGVVAVGAEGPFDGPARQAFSKAGAGDQAGQVVARATSPDGYHVELRVSEIGDRECVLFESDAPMPFREKYRGPRRAHCWTGRAPESQLRIDRGYGPEDVSPWIGSRYQVEDDYAEAWRADPPQVQGDPRPAPSGPNAHAAISYGRVKPGSRAIVWRDLFGDVRRCATQVDGWYFCYVPEITGPTAEHFAKACVDSTGQAPPSHGDLFYLLDGVSVERADGRLDVLHPATHRDAGCG